MVKKNISYHRVLFPAISHLVKIRRSPEKSGNEFRYFKTTLMEPEEQLMYSKKSVVSSVFGVISIYDRKFLFVLIMMKNISNAKRTRETINVSTIAVKFIIFLNGHLSGASVIDSKHIKMTGLQDFY